MTKNSKREEFLFKIYDQMFNDIDRHHNIVWETVGILVGAFAVFALAEKNIITIDIAVAIVIFLGSWVIVHVMDSNYWYNRNLVIIANIERQFLVKEDLKNIHYYFGEHRSENATQTSLKIQRQLALGIILILVGFHLSTRIFPGFDSEFVPANIDLQRSIPYAALVGGYFWYRWISDKRKRDYKEFVKNSPGIDINTKGITYGSGHPINVTEEE